MTDPAPEPVPQPQPVTGFATQLGAYVAGAFVAVGFVWFLIAGGITGENLGAVGAAVGGAVTAVVALCLFVWAHLGGKNIAAQVTPVASPRSAKGEELHTATEWTARSQDDIRDFADRLDAGFARWREQLTHHDDTQEMPVTGMHAHPTRKLGKRPTDPARPVLHMGAHLRAAEFTAPAQVDYASRVKSWLLGGNNRFGTCGPTSVANLALLVSTLLADAPVVFTDDEIFDLYRRSGNPTFDPATGAGDAGVDMTVMLAELVKNGIGFGDRNVKAVAFGSIDPHDTGKLWDAACLFGGVLWGSDLDVAQQSQTDQGLWDYVPRSGSWGGHATLSSPAYSDQAGTLADRTKLVTWQELIAATDAFISHQVSECYVVLFPWHLGDRRIYDGLDMAGVAAEYEQLTGRPFPAPISPPAPPAPTPGPAPSPAPSGPSADDIKWARKVLGERWRSREDHKIAGDILAMAGLEG